MIVDAISSRVVKDAIQANRLPNLQRLADAGDMRDQCTSIFPSLTLAATPSITTGVYPNSHGMLGAYWYNAKDNRVIYFGADYEMVFRQGPGQFLTDFLVGINDTWLNAPTIFERIAEAGLHAASINWFIYKGRTKHEIQMPLLHLVPNAPAATEIWGPHTLHLGSFTSHSEDDSFPDRRMEEKTSIKDRLGFTDEVTHQVLRELITQDALPDFTLAYFPDNDFRSHELGPEAASGTLETLDGYLGELFEAYGGIDRMLQDVAIIITGDHSQSNIVDDKDAAAIDLTQVIPDFLAAKVGKGFDDSEDIILCPNGRVVSIYTLDVEQQKFDRIIKRLIANEAVDQVMCNNTYLNSDQPGYRVFTSERGELLFGRSEAIGNSIQDRYGNQWYCDGSLDVFGEQEKDGSRVHFPTYPNPFERIAGLLDSPRGGYIWATPRIGHDFVIPGIDAHTGGGSHGSLHVLDSSSPIIASGLPEGVHLPDHPRIVDLVAICMKALGIETDNADIN